MTEVHHPRAPGWRRRTWLLQGLAVALLLGAAAVSALYLLRSPGLPKVALTTLAGQPTDLAAIAAGKPLVVNLWATWCTPCRLEMPLLASAQQQEPGVSFVFVNQGEYAEKAQRYLAASRLDLDNVLLDPGSHFGQQLGSAALPITLFYDADGRMLDSQVGGLTPDTLAGKLKRLRAPAPATASR